ncbi:hypothetical protein P153DRAFT_431540 [Dothidotthia symphoricarpi CBS 119687]|uniref:Serine hydrolase domain-containing protein n=1 Tax=Dothidotthia symphoricarpi CBS 119687 TaxID=1392245 RepID=A0A6A6ACW9_9PLEO|nr:uncharacterized protein P153DRAFT_431540 [Dothidotthia symphoricarpi CBS 119687]KAF2129620.1 hypothetical protein P153DRAFT_431540 [Dothidotthia symphoricarpi CBS 119687]
MPVRVLCLHGQGVNSAVFQKQTAPEVRDHYPPPYLTWYNTPTVDKVKDSHSQIQQIVEKQGPFDAVMGFGQGAAVAASLLLHQKLESKPPSFKAAVFISSPIPFARNTQYHMFHPTVDKVHIRVPTGHVMGTQDKWFCHSKDLVGLCQEEWRVVLQYHGGHEVPRTYTEEICDVVETMFGLLRE